MNQILHSSDSADQVNIRLSFPVRASIIVAFFTAALDFLYWYVTSSLKESLIFFGASAAAAGATLAAIYAARTLAFQIQQQAKTDRAMTSRMHHDRRVQAMGYAARWNEPHMEQARKVFREILEMSGSGVKEIDELLSSHDRELRVVHMLNVLEEVALSVQYKVSDAQVLQEIYGDAVIAVWRGMGQWAVHYRLKRAQPNAWKALEALSKDWG